MKLFEFLMFLVLVVPIMRGARWAYVAFVAMLLLAFPASIGFRVHPKACELTFNGPMAVQSLSNFPHITLFAIFFLMTMSQLRISGWRRFGWAIAASMAMGAAVEIAEGLSGTHHCKTVDLIPDLVGALLGLTIAVLAGAIGGKLFRDGQPTSM